MKNSRLILFAFIIFTALYSCSKKEDVKPQSAAQTVITPTDTLVKFTLYSNRTPYIWKRVVNHIWIEDTIKTNNAVRYEPFDKNNYGYGYWVTMNISGQPTDSLHITEEYKGKLSQMSSPKYQSAAYVLLDNVK